MSTILVDVTDGVATLTLNRPDKLNSFTAAMHGELKAALAQIAAPASAVRALILTGAGRGFCAGQDLEDRTMGEGDAAPDLAVTLETLYNPLILTLARLPMPVIAAVNGVAAGAGANVALACDIVLAGRSARFIQAFAKIGLVPDAGGTYHLPRLVGTARALGLALTAVPLSAEDAERWGLIWKAVDDDQLMAEAKAMAAGFARGPTKGLAAIKQALRFGAPTLDAQLDMERDSQQACGFTKDYREGVTAFFEKRPAKFTGE